MSFFDNLSQWNKLDTKSQRANTTDMNFTMLTVKEDSVDTHLFYQSTVNYCFSQKI